MQGSSDSTTTTWNPEYPAGWKRVGREMHGPCPVTAEGKDCCWVNAEKRLIGCRKCGGRLDGDDFIEHLQALGIRPSSADRIDADRLLRKARALRDAPVDPPPDVPPVAGEIDWGREVDRHEALNGIVPPRVPADLRAAAGSIVDGTMSDVDMMRFAAMLVSDPAWLEADPAVKAWFTRQSRRVLDGQTAAAVFGSLDSRTGKWRDAVPAPAADTGPTFTVVDFGDFRDLEVEPVEWLWDSRVERGETALLAGEPKTGKGMIAMSLVAAVTRGDALPGGPPAEGPERCAWIRGPGEDSLSVLKARAEAAGADLANLSPVDVQPVRGALCAAVSDAVARGANTVIVDSLAVFVAADEVEANDPSAARSYMTDLRTAAGTATLVVIAHWNKSEDSTDVNRVSGSHQFAAAARSVLVVQDGRLDVSRVNNAESPLPLGFSIVTAENGTGAVAWDGPVTGPPSGGGGGGRGGDRLPADIREVFRTATEPLTKSQLNRELGNKSAPAKTVVRRAVEAALKRGDLVAEKVLRGGREWDGYTLSERASPEHGSSLFTMVQNNAREHSSEGTVPPRRGGCT